MKNKIYQKIFEKISICLPKEWLKIVFFAGYTEGSYSIKFFVKNDKHDYVDCFALPGISKTELIKLFMDIDKILSADRKDKGWSIFTMIIDNTGKIEVEFEYDEHSEDLITYEENWREKYLKQIRNKLVKIIYLNTWKTEIAVYKDVNEEHVVAYYLMPTDNTKPELLQTLGFQKNESEKWILQLDSPKNYNLTWDDVIDVEEINGILAIICEKDGLLSVNPAFGGSGFAIDSYYMALGTYGNFGDYVKIACSSCGKSWYFNQSKIPYGAKYEVPCDKCGTFLIRKKV